MDFFILSLAFGAGVLLSFWNGANDNFKGVATLFGSGTVNYKTALIWTTLTTFAGSLAAFFFAQELLQNFSGKGLVPEEVLQMKSFSISVALAAGLTVFLATKLGFPISTTHALVGALVGSGLMASSSGVEFGKLSSAFFIPLLLSPLLSILAVMLVYPVLSRLRHSLGVKRESCLCVGSEVLQLAPVGVTPGQFTGALSIENHPSVEIGMMVTCEERYVGNFVGIKAKNVLDGAHFLSSGLVCFARALNDTPKIAAILIAASSLSLYWSTGAVGVAMALGGLLFSRKVAETMSFQITTMNDGQGFTSNLVTGLIVIMASRLGMPVSTTHVSCGSLFGIGLVTKSGDLNAITKIVSSWLITLPVAFFSGLVIFQVIKLL